MCPWNVSFASELKEPAYAAREAVAGRDARTLARELLAMWQEEFSRAFGRSPLKRAKLRGLKRDAAVVLGKVGTRDDAALLEHMTFEEPDEMLREHAAWARAPRDDGVTSAALLACRASPHIAAGSA